MKLDSIILNSGKMIGNIISAGLLWGAIEEASQGHYDLATAEFIAATYIQISKYQKNKIQEKINEKLDELNQNIIPRLQLLQKQIEASPPHEYPTTYSQN